MKRRTFALRAAVSALALLVASQASAETLSDTLLSAVQTSPRLASAREQVKAVRQALPLAWAEALPQITGSASANRNDRSEKVPAFFVREQKEYWVSTLTTSTLLFGSGRVFSSTQQARAQVEGAVQSYRNAAQEFMLDVIRAYGDVMYAQSVKEAQDRAMDNFNEQYRYVDANVTNGFLTKTDLAQASSRVEQARANVALANAQLVRANEAYLQLVGRPAEKLEPAPALPGLPADLDEALAIAGRENPTVLSATQNAKAADWARNAAVSAGLPRVTLETSHSIFEAFGQDHSRQQSEDIYAVRVTQPLFTGGAISARARQERHLRNAAHYDLNNTEAQVREATASAWASLDSARASLTASLARVDATELAQRGMLREQQAGQRTVIDVLNQEEELLSARIDVARAKRDMLIADRELAARIGRLAALSFDNPPPEAIGDKVKRKKHGNGKG